LLESSTGIIAEFKRRSPSKGFIREDADAGSIVGGYSGNGAAAVSVLTDRDYFAGKPADLKQARKVTNIPLLRKDFIIDPYQICEARIWGADAILLIAAALTPGQCRELAAFAVSVGLEVLLELHNEAELDYVNDNIHVVGINNRDLTTFETNTDVSKRLAALLPRNIVRISESGISSPGTVKDLRKSGFSGFLMGENFMKQPDPAGALGAFIRQLEEP
jgi:indole-3-glycerol phosphate synthase